MAESKGKMSADLKRRYLKHNYEKCRKEYEGFNDDRRVFCNIYDILIEALNVMEKVDNNFIWVAFNNECEKDVETLNRIKDYFDSKKEKESEIDKELEIELGR